MASYKLMPNEIVIKQDSCVSHGGVMAIYTGELILTNYNLIYVNKGVFGNTKDVLYYPLMQLKQLNGKPHAIVGKLSNGSPCLEVFMLNGASETFHFQTAAKKTTKSWAETITGTTIGGTANVFASDEDDNGYDPGSLVGQFKEVGDEFKEIGEELFSAIGFTTNPFKKKANVNNAQTQTMITSKCRFCSAPLTGKRGQTVRCEYCDSEQVL